ncbi:hypothetical protein D1BOALGB6SA_8847 [Olavius sp. associated proteobacterium Delta 1]|nr:hypothetical protein D1BOALGB6SA_8847 [Olavius sp. associated proteobacterium Delta 1]
MHRQWDSETSSNQYPGSSNSSFSFRLTFLLKVVLVKLLFVNWGSAAHFQGGRLPKANDWYS